MVNKIWTTFSPVPVYYSVLNAANEFILPVHLLMNESNRMELLVVKSPCRAGLSLELQRERSSAVQGVMRLQA